MPTELEQDNDALLPPETVKRMFGVTSNTTLHNWMKRGFPRPIFFGRQVRRWRASEIEEWKAIATKERPAPLPKLDRPLNLCNPKQTGKKEARRQVTSMALENATMRQPLKSLRLLQKDDPELEFFYSEPRRAFKVKAKAS